MRLPGACKGLFVTVTVAVFAGVSGCAVQTGSGVTSERPEQLSACHRDFQRLIGMLDEDGYTNESVPEMAVTFQGFQAQANEMLDSVDREACRQSWQRFDAAYDRMWSQQIPAVTDYDLQARLVRAEADLAHARRSRDDFFDARLRRAFVDLRSKAPLAASDLQASLAVLASSSPLDDETLRIATTNLTEVTRKSPPAQDCLRDLRVIERYNLDDE